MSRYFGEIRQLGYVVKDVERAMQHWIEAIGVGPWFYVADVPMHNFHYLGKPSGAKIAVALANSGFVQVELIQALDEEPSMFRDFLRAGREGLQHLAYWPTDWEGMVQAAEKRGYRIGQTATVGEMGPMAYLTTEAHPGTVVELSKATARRMGNFTAIREASVGWDGRDPIRTSIRF